MFFVLPCIVIFSYQKIKKIKDPSINNSYCVISLYMIYATIFSAIWTFLSNIVILIFYFIDEDNNYKDDDYIEDILHVVDIIGKLACNLILYLQTYEWVSMINIINFQKRKNMNEIMFETNHNYSNFLIKEKVRNWTFVLLSAVLISYSVYEHYNNFEDETEMFYENLIAMVIPIIFHVFVMIILLWRMSKYHNF